MLWLIPFLLLCLFLVFRFIPSYEPVGEEQVRHTGDRLETGDRRQTYRRQTGHTGDRQTEGFLAPLLVSAEFKKEYQAFLGLYLPFMTRWRDALITTYQLEQPSLGTKEPTDVELNNVATKLSTKLGKPLPSLSLSTFPPVETLEDIERGQLLDRIPSSSQSFMDALEWMNQKFIQAEKDLNLALQGGGIPSLDGFTDGVCANISTCFKENPDLFRQLSAAQQEEAEQRLERIQRELIGRFQQFQQPRLQTAFELNERLSKKAKETQKKAQSGDWIKDVRIKGDDKGPKPVAPPGGSALEDLRLSNPEKYAEYQKSNSSMFSIKQLMEQINRNLR